MKMGGLTMVFHLCYEGKATCIALGYRIPLDMSRKSEQDRTLTIVHGKKRRIFGHLYTHYFLLQDFVI